VPGERETEVRRHMCIRQPHTSTLAPAALHRKSKLTVTDAVAVPLLERLAVRVDDGVDDADVEPVAVAVLLTDAVSVGSAVPDAVGDADSDVLPVGDAVDDDDAVSDDVPDDVGVMDGVIEDVAVSVADTLAVSLELGVCDGVTELVGVIDDVPLRVPV
jgi:hypothetical protein